MSLPSPYLPTYIVHRYMYPKSFYRKRAYQAKPTFIATVQYKDKALFKGEVALLIYNTAML